jgi:hypothetical protein
MLIFSAVFRGRAGCRGAVVAPIGGVGYRAFTLGPVGRHRPRSRALVRALSVCAALTGLLVAVLWPSRSFAAIVPACENDFVSREAAPAPSSPADQSCDPAAKGDDIDNSRAAPICDLRGASAIAPPRLHGVSDVRLDRGRPCESTDSLRQAASPGRGDPPVQAPEATVEHAVLPAIEMVGPAPEARLIEPPVRTGGPRAGVRHAIYHPPR